MRLNLLNKTLQVAVNLNPPFVDVSNHQLTGGLEVKILDTLAEYYNFRYEISDCNSSWGILNQSGRWTGMIGRLNRHEADIGVGGVTVSFDRLPAVKYLYPHVVSTVSFITHTPTLKPNIYLVFSPLGWNVWLILICTIMVSALFDVIYNRVHGDRPRSKVFWYGMNLLFRQQYNFRAPSRMSVSIWNTFWAFTMFMLTSGYAVCLFSLITVPIKMETIDTGWQLANAATAKKVVVASVAGSVFTPAFNQTKLPMYLAIGRHMILVPHKTAGTELVVTRPNGQAYAFVSPRDYLRYAQLFFGEDAIHLPEGPGSNLYTTIFGIPVSPSFAYIAEFNHVLTQLIAVGLVHHWRENEYLNISRKRALWKLSHQGHKLGVQGMKVFTTKKHSAFSLAQLQSFFYVYLFSILFSFSFFLLEMIHFVASKHTLACIQKCTQTAREKREDGLDNKHIS